MSLQLSLDSNGKNIEIARPAVISKNRNSSDPLPLTNYKIENEKITYFFKSDSNLDKVYVKSPILYITDEIAPISVPMNSIVLNNGGQDQALSQKKTFVDNWFTIDSADVRETDEGGKVFVISIRTLKNDLPRLPKLVIDGIQYVGDTVHSFDNELNFTSAEFLFNLPEEYFDHLPNVLQDAEIIIDKALLRAYDNTNSSEPFAIALDVNANK